MQNVLWGSILKRWSFSFHDILEVFCQSLKTFFWGAIFLLLNIHLLTIAAENNFDLSYLIFRLSAYLFRMMSCPIPYLDSARQGGFYISWSSPLQNFPLFSDWMAEIERFNCFSTKIWKFLTLLLLILPSVETSRCLERLSIIRKYSNPSFKAVGADPH